jgi:catechol 2,3-dioxygenase-like lactoylglutathione lyase family enzyme
MDLLAGINHTALLSADIDRLARFYVRVLGARVALDMAEGGLRIVMIDVGRGSSLAAFQLEDTDVPRGGLPEFGRVATIKSPSPPPTSTHFVSCAAGWSPKVPATA